MKEYIFAVHEKTPDAIGLSVGQIRRHSKELIRCKDCIHHHGHDCENMNYWLTSDDFYCGWAERKEE